MNPFEDEICDQMATRFIAAVGEIEQTGIRRDLIITGIERALKRLSEEPPTRQ